MTKDQMIQEIKDLQSTKLTPKGELRIVNLTEELRKVHHVTKYRGQWVQFDDVTPKWVDILHMLVQARKMTELTKMAQAADNWNEHITNEFINEFIGTQKLNITDTWNLQKEASEFCLTVGIHRFMYDSTEDAYHDLRILRKGLKLKLTN